jgi:hypothetical protein
MKQLFTTTFALALVSSAEAMPVPQLQQQDSMIITVAEGCGAGFHRVGGRCVRNAAGGAVVVQPRVVAKPPVVGPRVVVRPAVVRPWARRSYFGTVVAGVTLGTLIAVTAAPPPPASNLCWYWTTPAHNQGYWDYCQ